MYKTSEISGKTYGVDFTITFQFKEVFQGLLVYELIAHTTTNMIGFLQLTLTIYNTDFIKQDSDFIMTQHIMIVNMQDVWVLDAAEKQRINDAVGSLSYAKKIATISAFTSNFLSGGSIAVGQVMMVMGMVNVLKYVPLNWPPNIIKQFTVKSVDLNYLFPISFQDNVYQLKAFPAKYASYRISSLFLNNYGEKLS